MPVDEKADTTGKEEPGDRQFWGIVWPGFWELLLVFLAVSPVFQSTLRPSECSAGRRGSVERCSELVERGLSRGKISSRVGVLLRLDVHIRAT